MGEKYPTTLCAIAVILSIINGITVIGLTIYLPTVYLNYTFTSTFLTTADVPYYSVGLGSSQTNRYNANWFMSAMDVFMIIPPVMVFYTAFMVLLREKTDDLELQPPSIIFYYVITIIIAIMEYVKMIYKIIQYIYCEDRNFCRNFDPSGNPGIANYVFLFDLSFSIIFPVLATVYVAMGLVIKNYVTGYKATKIKV